MPTLQDNAQIDAASGSEGLLDALSGTPANGDTVIIARNQLYTATGQQDLNVDLAAHIIMPSHRLEIDGLQFDATTGAVHFGGSGRSYKAASTGAKAVWAACTVAPGSGTTTHEFSDVTINTLYGQGGGALSKYGSNADIGNGYFSGGEHHLIEGGAAATALRAMSNTLLRLDRDSGSLQLDDSAKAVVNSITCVLATLLMTSKNTAFDPRRVGNIGTIGAAAGGARGELNFLKLETPFTITTLYESDELTIVLPRAYPGLVTFPASPDRANGRAKYVYE